MKTNTILLALVSMVFSVTIAKADMTIVSWGGAYTKSQTLAYHEPYTAKTGIKIITN